MSRHWQLTLDAHDPRRLGQFWAAVLGYVEEPPPRGYDSWPAALADPEGNEFDVH